MLRVLLLFFPKAPRRDEPKPSCWCRGVCEGVFCLVVFFLFFCGGGGGEIVSTVVLLYSFFFLHQ